MNRIIIPLTLFTWCASFGGRETEVTEIIAQNISLPVSTIPTFLQLYVSSYFSSSSISNFFAVGIDGTYIYKMESSESNITNKYYPIVINVSTISLFSLFSSHTPFHLSNDHTAIIIQAYSVNYIGYKGTYISFLPFFVLLFLDGMTMQDFGLRKWRQSHNMA